jgi:arginine decarboxylase
MLRSQQERMPIVETLIRHIQKNPVPMHVPGHKMGRGFPSALGAWMESALKLDLTEIEGLDDLHHPTGAILEAQQLAAEAFCADATFFLINGSTAGNYAMLFAACRPGDRVIVARNFHKSVLQALILRNLQPVFMDLPIDPLTGSAGPVSIELVRQAVQQYPDAKAVFLTSPTYQGIVSPIAEIAECVHAAGMLLLVDEAHGAHFLFHPELRKYAAILQGADLVVQSTHKMLGSLTQTAMLHVKGHRIDHDRVRRYVSYFQSSSPSYLLLASLDAVRSMIATQGEQLLEQAIARWEAFYLQAKTWRHIQVVSKQPFRDPFKICLRFSRGTVDLAERWLREHHHIFLEMITTTHALAIATFADTDTMVKRFTNALSAYEAWLDANGSGSAEIPTWNSEGFKPNRGLSKPVINYQDLDDFDWEWLPITETEGRIAKYAVIPYPPGIPLFCPGERIQKRDIEELLLHLHHHGRVQGMQRDDQDRIAVLKGI